uniref:hypothetical protein n=1 Tax=Acetobacter senegalensis TaxID=446692 RepID=UPI0038D13B64
MMLQIHLQARTTPAVRADIARSSEPASVLARRYGISDETVRKWRRRGSDACQNHSSRPWKLTWKASEEECGISCLIYRDSIWRILKDAGLNGLPSAPKTAPVREHSGITIPVMSISM